MASTNQDRLGIPSSPWVGRWRMIAPTSSPPELLEEEPGKHPAAWHALLLGDGQRDEEHQEGNRESVIEASLHIQCLTNPLWYARALHDHLPETRIGKTSKTNAVIRTMSAAPVSGLWPGSARRAEVIADAPPPRAPTGA